MPQHTFPSSPWIQFNLQLSQSVISFPKTILSSNTNYCILDGLLITNTTQHPLLIDVKIRRTDASDTATTYHIAKQQPLDSYSSIDLMKNSCLYLQPGDELLANSDFLEGEMDCVVSYRELISPTQA